MIHTSNGKRFFVEQKLWNEMQKFTTAALKKKDNNKIFIICGDTGIGKSAFGFQLASILDPGFSLKNIQFTTEEIKRGLRTLHNQAVVFDEAFRGASGRSSLNREQKGLLQMLYEIRQLNQIVILISPSFFRLDEAIAVELSDAMFHVHKTGSGRRGFRMFNNKKKSLLYYRARKGKKSYNLVPSMFNGVFPDTYVVDEKEYRDKKFQSLFGKTEETNDKTKEFQRKMYDREARILKAFADAVNSKEKVSQLVTKAGVPLGRSIISERIAAIASN